MDIIIAVVVAVAIIGGLVISFVLKRRHRQELMHERFPEEYIDILQRYVALYSLLPDGLKQELHGRIAIFLDEKEFEGCGGLEITTRVKVTIAALACLLLLNKDFDYYPKLNSVLVYPDAYIASDSRSSLGGVAVVEKESTRLGESWDRGNLVLSWHQIEDEAADIHCHHNVVIHEFAHQLDQLDGYADGTPPLPDKGIYPQWREIMTYEYEHLCLEAEHAVRDVIDWYGATNPAEFFAVTSESFFCNPLALRHAHDRLYGLFVDFYQLDPASWRE
jgi:hypothetical protein